MSYFSEQFLKHCQKHGTTPYKVSITTPNLDPSKVSKAMHNRKMEDKAWDSLLRGLSENTLAPIEYETLAGWRAVDKYGLEILKKAVDHALKQE